MNRFLLELLINLKRVFWLRCFKKVSLGGHNVSPAVLLVMLCASLSAKALVNYVAAGPDPYFNEWGLASILAAWAVFTLMIALVSDRKAPVPLSQAVNDLAGVALVNSLLLLTMHICWKLFARELSDKGFPIQNIWYGAMGCVGLWSLITLWRTGNRLWRAPIRFPGARFAIAAMIPALLIPRSSLYDGPNTDWSRNDIWYFARDGFYSSSASETTEASGPIVDYETTFYQQPAMVEKALSGIRPPAGAAPQFYFLGMAPSSAQTVFKSEVLGAQATFETQLDTKGHSLSIINSEDTLMAYPLASVSNLDLALSGIAKIMRPEKDVLALFVTSHGSAGLISVSLPGFPLNEIKPELLQRALIRSKIKNRVIIISACYSGSFIPTLANDDTLIMTAASAEKTSFGCSNERDWTYFGDALFNHALKKTDSLPQAFKIARDLINEWEAEQKLTHSDPQISLGKNIARVLESMKHKSVGEIASKAN